MQSLINCGPPEQLFKLVTKHDLGHFGEYSKFPDHLQPALACAMSPCQTEPWLSAFRCHPVFIDCQCISATIATAMSTVVSYFLVTTNSFIIFACIREASQKKTPFFQNMAKIHQPPPPHRPVQNFLVWKILVNLKPPLPLP